MKGVKTMANRQDIIRGTSTSIVRLMGSIEGLRQDGLMFHEVYPDLDRRFREASDAQDLRALRSVYIALCKEHDRLSMDEGDL